MLYRAVINTNKTGRLQARKVLLFAILFLFSLYIINVIGNLDGASVLLGKRRYLNVLWALLAIYLIVFRREVEWSFFWERFSLVLPIFLVCIFLYFYHGRVFDLSHIKYVFLFILASSVICKERKIGLRYFFTVNSISCLIIFFVAVYQMWVLKCPVPNGDINQNVFACFAAIIGNVSLFSVLYKNLGRRNRLLFSLCGILAIWVALRTTCRTAYVTEVFLVGLLAFLACTKLKWSWRKATIFLLSMAIVLLFLAVEGSSVTEWKFKAIPSEILNFLELGKNETTNTSVGLRLAMWKAAFTDLLPNHLCFGIGDVRELNLLGLISNSNIDKDFLKEMGHFHNEGVNVLVMGGLLLFIVSNWLLYRLFIIAKSESVLLCLLVAAVTWGMTEVAFYHKPVLIVFLSIWLLYECAIRNERRNAVESGRDSKNETVF